MEQPCLPAKSPKSKHESERTKSTKRQKSSFFLSFSCFSSFRAFVFGFTPASAPQVLGSRGTQAYNAGDKA
jgi:hypothetical protein